MGQGNNERVINLVDKIIEINNPNKKTTKEVSKETEMAKIIKKSLSKYSERGQEAILTELEAKVEQNQIHIEQTNGIISIQSFLNVVNEIIKEIPDEIKMNEEITHQSNSYSNSKSLENQILDLVIFNKVINDFANQPKENINYMLDHLSDLSNEQLTQFKKSQSDAYKKIAMESKNPKTKEFYDLLSKVAGYSYINDGKKYVYTDEEMELQLRLSRDDYPELFSSREFKEATLEERVKLLYRAKDEKSAKLSENFRDDFEAVKNDKTLTPTEKEKIVSEIRLDLEYRTLIMKFKTHPKFLRDEQGNQIDAEKFFEDIKNGIINEPNAIVILKKAEILYEKLNKKEIRQENFEENVRSENSKIEEQKNNNNLEMKKNLNDAVISKKSNENIEAFNNFKYKKLLRFNGEAINVNDFIELDIEQQQLILLRAEFARFEIENSLVDPDLTTILEESQKIESIADIEDRENFSKQLKKDNMEMLEVSYSTELVALDKKNKLNSRIESIPDRFYKEGYSKEEIAEALKNYKELFIDLEEDDIEEFKNMDSKEVISTLKTFIEDSEIGKDNKSYELLNKIIDTMDSDFIQKCLVDRELNEQEFLPALEEQIQALENPEKVNDKQTKSYMSENSVEIDTDAIEKTTDKDVRNDLENSSVELKSINTKETDEFKKMMIPKLLENLSAPNIALAERLAKEQGIERSAPGFYDIIQIAIVTQDKELKDLLENGKIQEDEDGYEMTLNDQKSDNEVLIDAKKRFLAQKLFEDAAKSNLGLSEELKQYLEEKGISLDEADIDYREIAAGLSEEEMEKYPNLGLVAKKIKGLDEKEYVTITNSKESKSTPEQKSEDTRGNISEQQSEVTEEKIYEQEPEPVKQRKPEKDIAMVEQKNGFFSRLRRTFSEAFNKTDSSKKNFFVRLGEAFKRNFGQENNYNANVISTDNTRSTAIPEVPPLAEIDELEEPGNVNASSRDIEKGSNIPRNSDSTEKNKTPNSWDISEKLRIQINRNVPKEGKEGQEGQEGQEVHKDPSSRNNEEMEL